MGKKIFLYTGEGTWITPFSDLPFTPLSAKDLIYSPWDEKASMLIMPGGRDRPYMEALRGLGNAKIGRFVQKGGVYLGICAGAYYGASKIEFEKGSLEEIVEARELKFFEGCAKGPVFHHGSYTYRSPACAKAAKLAAQGGEFSAYYHGGCTFLGDLGKTLVLARYKELPGLPPAVIACPVGEGTAILSGVHLEVSSHHLRTEEGHLKASLQESESFREKFFKSLFTLIC